ncbi:hypothetical protein RvVAT039_09700 [Agrobacterium vitis]|nr:hypothetical protein RvVAT039_09700 [Agrobacterium vitis]
MLGQDLPGWGEDWHCVASYTGMVKRNVRFFAFLFAAKTNLQSPTLRPFFGLGSDLTFVQASRYLRPIG